MAGLNERFRCVGQSALLLTQALRRQQRASGRSIEPDSLLAQLAC